MGGAYSSDDGLLLLLEVLVEFSPGPVVPDEVRVLRVTVQDLQQLQDKSQDRSHDRVGSSHMTDHMTEWAVVT